MRMRRRSNRAKTICITAWGVFIALFVVYMFACWIDIVAHNGNRPAIYAGWNVLITHTETETRVWGCSTANENGYEVIVEDNSGNLWAYYADEPVATGTHVTITRRGDEVINAKEEN